MGELGERKSCRFAQRETGLWRVSQSPAQGWWCLLPGRASHGQERQGPQKSPVLGWADDGGPRPLLQDHCRNRTVAVAGSQPS